MQNKKFMAIPILLIIALGLVGFAYASWYNHLYINGQINTAEIKMKFLSVSADDSHPGDIDIGKDKDVGITSARIVDDTRIEFTITNAYLCYETYVHFSIQNVGTIPVHFKGLGPQPPFAYDPADGRWKATLFDGKITVHGWDSINEQLDPGWTKDYTIWIHVEQSAQQSTTYTFTIEVIFSQWNAID